MDRRTEEQYRKPPGPSVTEGDADLDRFSHPHFRGHRGISKGRANEFASPQHSSVGVVPEYQEEKYSGYDSGSSTHSTARWLRPDPSLQAPLDNSEQYLKRARELITGARRPTVNPLSSPAKKTTIMNANMNETSQASLRAKPSQFESGPHPLANDKHYRELELQDEIRSRNHPGWSNQTARGANPSSDNKDRPLTVRDMEGFVETIQDTMREMGKQFLEAIALLQRLDTSESEGSDADGVMRD